MSGGWLNTRNTWSHETRPMEDEKQRKAQLKPVPKFYDVHVHAEAGWSVQAGIG